MKKLVFALLYCVGAVRLATWWHRKRVRILCYHGVTERPARSPKDPAGLHVRLDRFETHLEYLQRNFNVVSLQEFLAAKLAGRKLPDYTVALTFDDGYRNFLTVAAPHLSLRQMPATVYLITDRVSSGAAESAEDRWSETDDEGFLSWDEARRLQNDFGIEFGSHSCSHPKLTSLTPDEVTREFKESQTLIARNLNKGAMTFAYPYGDYNRAIAEQARQSGYTCAVTTDEGVNDQSTGVFALRRTLIGDDDDRISFAVRVSGVTSWLRFKSS